MSAPASPINPTPLAPNLNGLAVYRRLTAYLKDDWRLLLLGLVQVCNVYQYT
jgi:hypothetical protein